MPVSEIVLPPTLELHPRYLASPIADLVKLPATDLVAELLARVLAGGIGRLFFEQQQSQGRILWSQNGVLQATLEGLLPDQMHTIVDELKTLSNLPLTPLTTPRQIEIERIYQNARLLLRFRFMPGNYGEEATLQVLRGAALKFHHQQQSTGTGHELLGFAEHLQRKVDELLDHAQSDPSVLADDTLSRLRSVVIGLGDKLSRLEALNYRRDG
jgi:type II secretory ATPase GspE/PulE/Tfp pilus assembly ATPase PilB-like protein